MSQIVKAKGQEKFVTIPNELARDNSLSLKARGLITYLLSMPTDWVIYKSKLHTQVNDGREGVNKAFNELVAAGYILEVKTIDTKTGQFIYDYIVYPEPTIPPLTGSRTREAVNGEPYTESRKPYKEDTNKEIKQKTIYTLTTSSEGQTFESLKAEKEKAPPVPRDPPEYCELPEMLVALQDRFNAWIRNRELTHGRLGIFEQENQIMLFVGFCNRNNLNHYQFFEHCLTCAGGGNWKNLNPDLANKTFTVKQGATQKGLPKSKVAQNVQNILDYASRPENQ